MLQLHFVARFAAQYGKQVRGLTHRAQIRLSRHSWPGNVRELENVIGHAVMMTTSDMVDAQDLPPYLHASSEEPEKAAVAAAPNGGTLAEMERQYIFPGASGDWWRNQLCRNSSRGAAYDLKRDL